MNVRIKQLVGTAVVVSAAVILSSRGSPAAEPGFTVSPTDGTTVTAGDTVTVRLTPDPGTVLTWAGVVSPIGSAQDFTSPFELPIQVPTTFTGPIKLLIAGRIPAGNIGVEIRLNVEPSGSVDLENLLVEPASLSLARIPPYPGQHIVVNGDFSDGITRDLGRSLDTTYSSSDPTVAVILVTDDGAFVQAKRVGSTTVTVSNHGLLATLPVEVAGTIDGDVNQDCVVDYRDVNIATNALGADVRDPRYLGIADSNSNGAIDATDVAYIRARLGTKCP